MFLPDCRIHSIGPPKSIHSGFVGRSASECGRAASRAGSHNYGDYPERERRELLAHRDRGRSGIDLATYGEPVLSGYKLRKQVAGNHSAEHKHGKLRAASGVFDGLHGSRLDGLGDR